MQIQQFWHDLEVATNEKHQQLISVLNQHLDNLARVVEKVVGGTLNLKLEPVIISLEPPTAQQFHNSVEKLFAAGIWLQAYFACTAWRVSWLAHRPSPLH